MLSDSQFDELKEAIRVRVDIRDLVEEAGGTLRNDSGACVLHGGDNPTAFHVYENGRRWHCFTNCPEGENGGDVFAFYKRWKGLPFWNAFLELAARAGIEVKGAGGLTPNPHPQPLSLSGRGESAEEESGPGEGWRKRGEAFVEWAQKELLDPVGGRLAREYLINERGLYQETWEQFRLGYNPKDVYDKGERWGFGPSTAEAKGASSAQGKVWLPAGIVIPGYWRNELWYVKVRRTKAVRMEGEGDLQALSGAVDRPKFAGPRGGKAALFGADAWLELPVLVLVEGELDAMLAWQEAHDFCDVASLGSATKRAGTAVLASLGRYAAVVQISDDDQAGEKARQAWGEVGRVRTARPPDHDLTDYMRAGGHLRGWLARLVGEELRTALENLDRRRYAEKAAEWELVMRHITTETQSTQRKT